MGINIYDPSKALGDKITELDRKSLCELCSALCVQLKARAGFDGYCGGIYPSNISVGDDGNVAIGEGRRKDFSTEEVKFTAPELFWKGESSAAADVYSLGMLLYFACSGGKMPFDEDSADAATAQQRRMNGERFRAPKAAGRRLGEIIEKATSFRVEDRYKNPDEMKAMVDSCVKNLYLNGEPNAETIFNKSDDDLSDIEKMMIAIIENNGEPEQPPSDETPAVETPAEEVPAAEEAPAEAEEAAEEPAEQAEEPAEEILPEEPQAEPESPVEEPEIAAEEINSETVPTGAPAEAILPEETAQPEEEAPAAPQEEGGDESSQNALVMAHVRRYLEDNYMFDISLDSVGEILHISPAYLSAQFKKYQKMNFLDCLTELRINAAKELLADPFRSSAEVASMVGYEDASYFARAFKKRTGMTPTQYRRQAGQKAKADPEAGL